MKGSGYYSDRVVWLRQREAKDGTAGAIGNEFDDAGILWCRIENPRGADKIQWSALQSVVDCMIRLRGNPGVRSVDRFRRESDGAVYVINGAHLDEDGDDQVCACALFSDKMAEAVP